MSWVDDDEASDFFHRLKLRKASAMELLLERAGGSSDPAVRQAWGSWMELVRVLREMEDERGKPDE